MIGSIFGVYIGDKDVDHDFLKGKFLIQELSGRQENCLTIRYIMDMLPSYAPASYNVLYLFTFRPPMFVKNFIKPPKQEMKSFRTVGLRLLEQINYAEKDQRDADNIRSYISSLRYMKGEFFRKYFKDRKMDLNEEMSKTKRLHDKIGDVAKDIEKLDKKIDEKKRHLEDILRTLEKMVNGSGKDDRVALEQLLKKVEVYQDFQVKARFADKHPQTKKDFQAFLTDELGQPDLAEKYEELLREKQKQKILTNLIEMIKAENDMIAEDYALEAEASDSMDYDKNLRDVDDLRKMNEDSKDKFDDGIESIQSQIRARVDQMVREVKTHDWYKKYSKNLKDVQIKNKKLKELKDEKSDLEKEKKRMEGELKNTEIDFEMDFTFAKTMQQRLDEKMLFLDKQSDFLDADLDFDQFGKKADYVRGLFDLHKDNFRREVAASQRYKDHVAKKKEDYEDIKKLEDGIDCHLGEVFAKAQLVDGDMMCFSVAELSYSIFTLVKINTILNEQEFLRCFFRHLPYIHVKKFIIFNYRIFVRKSYLDHVMNLDDLRPKLHSKSHHDKDKFIDMYIKSWSFLINSYKMYTQFGTDFENGRAKRLRMSRVFMGVLGFTFSHLFDNSKRGLGIIVGQIVGQIVSIIPFVKEFLVLKKIVGLILSQIISRIVLELKMILKDKFETKKGFIDDMARALKLLIKASDIVDFNYKKQINKEFYADNEDMPDQDPKDKVHTDEIERKYIETLDEPIPVEDKIFYYDLKWNTLKLPRIRNPAIMRDVDHLKAKLSPENLKDFEEEKQKVLDEENALREKSKRTEEKSEEVSSLGRSISHGDSISLISWGESDRLRRRKRERVLPIAHFRRKNDFCDLKSTSKKKQLKNNNTKNTKITNSKVTRTSRGVLFV